MSRCDKIGKLFRWKLQNHRIIRNNKIEAVINLGDIVTALDNDYNDSPKILFNNKIIEFYFDIYFSENWDMFFEEIKGE